MRNVATKSLSSAGKNMQEAMERQKTRHANNAIAAVFSWIRESEKIDELYKAAMSKATVALSVFRNSTKKF